MFFIMYTYMCVHMRDTCWLCYAKSRVITASFASHQFTRGARLLRETPQFHVITPSYTNSHEPLRPGNHAYICVLTNSCVACNYCVNCHIITSSNEFTRTFVPGNCHFLAWKRSFTRICRGITWAEWREVAWKGGGKKERLDMGCY